MTELSLKTKHRLNMNLYKDKVWVTVKKIFFPVTILAEDLCYAKNLIFSSIRIEQWDPKLFNDKFIFIYSILYNPCIFKAYRLLNVQT